jgi:S-formylglutathione hydrolase FrmB
MGSPLRLSLAIGAACATALLAASSSTSAASTKLQGTIEYGSYRSAALKGTVQYSIYLPAGYASSGKRYPVVYFLHGLPASPASYRSIGQIATAVQATGHQAIVVGVQGARAGDPDPEWLDRSDGRKWETATAKELVKVVDTRYRTLAERAGRVLIGISAGGYGAIQIALHNPTVYSVVESWSGYFHATNPQGTAALDLGTSDANERADVHKQIASVKRFLASSTPTYFAFYVGTNDARFRTENLEFYAELRRAGLSQIVFHLYRGGHNWALWTRHAVTWLEKALSVAADPR